MDLTEIRWQFYPRVAALPVARAFIEQQALLDKRPKTVDAYARAIEHLLAYFADQGISQVLEADEDDLIRYLAFLRQRPPRRPGRGGLVDDGAAPDTVRRLPDATLADSTIAQHLVACRLFFDYLLRKRLRQSTDHPLPRGAWGHGGIRAQRGMLRRRRHRLPWVPEDEAWVRFLTLVITREDPRTRAMILLAYDAALRREELVSLRLDDLDVARGLLTVRAETTKSGYSRRVPVSPGALHLLLDYVTGDRRLLLAAYGGEEQGPLFLSESTRNPGRPLAVGAFNEIVARLRTAVDLPALTPHTLRHQRCTLLKRAGVSLEDIRTLAGHRRAASTELYVHLIPTELGQRLRAAAEPFDAPIRALVAQVLGREVPGV
jgi:site-specific recombinase XerD